MARTLEVRIVGDTKDLERSLQRAGGKSSTFGDKLNKASLVAGGALGVMAIGAKKTIDAASDLGEQVNKVAVVFGNASPEIVAFGKTSAKSLGISNRAALEAAGVFGNMLVPMGFARKDAAGMSTKFVQLAADMASFNNASPEETLDALRAGLAGESEPLRRFGVFLNDARLKEQALKMGLYSGKGALDAHSKAAATAAIIMRDTKDAQGDFAKTATSAANASRIQAASTEDLNAKIGKGLLPAYQGLQAVMAAATGIMSEHSGVVKVVAGIVAVLAGAVITVTAATKAWAAMQAIATAAQWLFNAALTANPIGIVIVALAALAAAVVIAYQKSQTFRDIVQGAMGVVKAAITAVKTTFDTLLTAIKGVITWVQANWKTIAILISGPFAPLVALATNAFGVRSALVNAFTAVKNFVRDVVNDIVGFFQALPGRILGFATSVGSAFVKGISAGLAALGGALERLVKGPINAVISAWNGLGIPGFSLHIGMPGPVPDINFGWGGMSLPDIPHLAAGGIVRKPTLAMVGEAGPEAVVPLGRGAMPLLGGAREVVIPITLELDGQVLYRGLKRYGARDVSNNGGTGLRA